MQITRGPIGIPTFIPDGGAPEEAEGEREREDEQGEEGLEEEGAGHAEGGGGGGTVFEGVHEEQEDGAEELAAGPADDAADLRADRVRDFGQEFERERYQAEGAGPEEAGEDVGRDARARRPDEGEVTERHDGHLHFDREHRLVRKPVEQG